MAFNKLTPAEAERLALLAEEMGEAIQSVGKILRHGYESYHPAHPTGPNNRQSLERELGDVFAAVNLMFDAQDLDVIKVKTAIIYKLKRVKQYLHHQKKGKK